MPARRPAGTAVAACLPVLGGRVEATAIGNLLLQARTACGGLAALRGLVRQTQRIMRYEPGGGSGVTRAGAGRLEV
ncbi:hypothetical protein KBX50_03380 [Micromonospora sp. C51]|uniref:hypothetical protein n=1 Tax=Micromonospora sp. C51 TaxID=2824879 RepID=UPI001B396191|nr:hypothetical protein [Micromonospora sp. C51]MBQ1047530.1 hypothetical protein [Micromonospora sp. C51]